MCTPDPARGSVVKGQLLLLDLVAALRTTVGSGDEGAGALCVKPLPRRRLVLR